MAIRGVMRGTAHLCRGLVLAAALALAPPAVVEADVLVNVVEPPSVACGKSVMPGIWYQSFSGGPRWARITIKNSRGAIVWHKNATATTKWRFWRFRGKSGASYVLIYKVPGGTVRWPFHVHRA
jgi:hypothetical protein